MGWRGGELNLDIIKEGNRIQSLHQKVLHYQKIDPEVSLSQARKTAEAICKRIYQDEGLHRNGKPPDKMMLNDLVQILSRNRSVPRHILMPLGTIQTYGNYGAHDQSDHSGTMDEAFIQPCIQALNVVVHWFFQEYRRFEEQDEKCGDFVKKPPINLISNRLGIPPYIFSRPSLINAIMQRIEWKKEPYLLLQGLPGSGKTTLLFEVSRKLWGSFDHILLIQFSGAARTEPLFFIEKLNGFLKHIDEKNVLPNPKSTGGNQAIEHLAITFQKMNTLLLFDSIDESISEQILLFLKGIEGGERIRILLTARSRCRIDPGRIIMLPPLSKTESLHFVRQFVSYSELEVDVDKIIDSIPDRIRTHPHSLSTFLLSLADIPIELLLHDGPSSESTAGIELMMKILSALEEERLKSIAFITILNDLDVVGSIKILNLKPPDALLSAIPHLISRSLIHRLGNAYHVPSIVTHALQNGWSHMLENAAKGVAGEMMETLLSRLDAAPDDLFDAQIPIITEIIHRFYHLDYLHLVLKVTFEGFLEFVNIRGYWKEYFLLLKLAFEAGKSTGDVETAVRAGFRIIRKSIQTSDMDLGKSFLNRVERVVENSRDQMARAELCSHRALLKEMEGDYSTALTHLAESRSIRQSIGDRQGIGIVEKLIGNIALRKKDYLQARESYGAALAQLESIVSSSSEKEIIEIETSLSLCDLREKHIRHAENRLREMEKRCQQIGYHAGLPRIYYNLSLAFQSKGNIEQAIKYAEMSRESAKRTNHDILVGATILIWKLNSLKPN